MAYIQEVDVGKHYISVRVAGLSTSYSYDGRYAIFSIAGQSSYHVDIEAGDKYSPTVTFTGLPAETSYTIYCTIGGIVGSDDKEYSITVETESANKIGDPILDWYKEKTDDGFMLTAYLYNLSTSYYDDDRTITFAIYHSGDPYNPIEVQSGIVLDAQVASSNDCIFSTLLSYDTEYVLGASIYKDGALLYDLDVVDVYVSSLSTNIVSAVRQEDPRYAKVTVYNTGIFSDGFYVISQYYDLSSGQYVTYNSYEITNVTIGEISLTVDLCHFGKSRVGIGVFKTIIEEDYDVYYFDAIPLSNSIKGDTVEFGQYFYWTIDGLVSHSVEVVGIEYYVNDEYIDYRSIDAESTETSVILDWNFNSEQYGSKITLKAMVYDNGYCTHIITRPYLVPEHATATIAVSRDENNPTTVYASVWVNARADMSRVRIMGGVIGGTTGDLEIYYNPTSYPLDFTFYNMSTEEMRFRVRAYATISDEEYFVTSNYVYLDAHTPETTVDPWTWEDSNGTASQAQTINAFNALDLKLATSNFSYLVWNDLVEKVREAYLAKNGEENTVYEGYLDEALMNDTDTDTGKVLTATRFNDVRATIGGILATFDVNSSNYLGPAEGNSIYNHYDDKLNWDMQSGEQVLGAYITDLATFLNIGINEINGE